jgi:hypothetical protein
MPARETAGTTAVRLASPSAWSRRSSSSRKGVIMFRFLIELTRLFTCSVFSVLFSIASWLVY